MPRIESDLDTGSTGGGGGITVEVDPNALKIANDLSDVVNPTDALNNLLPAQTPGKVLSTNGSQPIWVDPSGGGASKNTTILVTGTINSGTTISLIGSGVNYTKSGDNAFLGNSALEFQQDEKVLVYRNGQLLSKVTEVNFVSSTSISLNAKLYVDEELLILS